MNGCSDNNGNSALSTDGLIYRYGSFTVWEDVCIKLQKEEIAFLLGVNGSGKSTLLRCLAGWTAPKSGTILLNGKPFSDTDRSQRAQVYFVPDTPAFYDDLTAEEHIGFVLQANRKEHLGDNAARLLADFGLERHKRQLPSSYSRGMREKLALVLALSLQPDVLLLDEPYGPLDQRASSVLSSELRAAATRGAAVIVSCHHPVFELSPHRVFHLHDGRLDNEGPSFIEQSWQKSHEADTADSPDL